MGILSEQFAYNGACAFQTVMKRIEARQDVQEIFSERFSVSEKIDSILQRVATGTLFVFLICSGRLRRASKL